MDAEERELLGELEALGLDAESFRAIALLPLVEVAWADGRTQPDERRLIAEIARGHSLLQGQGMEVLKGWLLERPSADAFDRGRKLFVKLAMRKQGVGADLPESSLEFVVDLCAVVAESAGGLFGLFFTTSDSERAAIAAITNKIDKEASKLAPKRGIVGRTISMDWKELMSALDDTNA